MLANHTLNFHNYSSVILLLPITHFSLQVAGTPAIVALGCATTIHTATTQRSNYHLAILKHNFWASTSMEFIHIRIRARDNKALIKPWQTRLGGNPTNTFFNKTFQLQQFPLTHKPIYKWFCAFWICWPRIFY